MWQPILVFHPKIDLSWVVVASFAPSFFCKVTNSFSADFWPCFHWTWYSSNGYVMIFLIFLHTFKIFAHLPLVTHLYELWQLPIAIAWQKSHPSPAWLSFLSAQMSKQNSNGLSSAIDFSQDGRTFLNVSLASFLFISSQSKINFISIFVKNWIKI